MSSDTGTRNHPLKRFLRFRFLWKVGALVLVIGAVTRLFGGVEETRATATTFEVRRGDLPIAVVEGGNAESLEPQTIKCEVKGREGVKIISIIDEGYHTVAELGAPASGLALPADVGGRLRCRHGGH